MHTMPYTSGREAAFFALLTAWREEQYLQDFFDACRAHSRLSNEELRLAQEIAYGTARHLYAIEYQAKCLAIDQKLSLKRKEKVLLYIALYQSIYMDRLPAYAIVNESVALAKKHIHPRFAAFVNAILRKLSQGIPILPFSKEASAWSIRYSMPATLVSSWIAHFGLDATQAILKAFETPPPLFIRRRSGCHETCDLTLEEEASLPSSFFKIPKGTSFEGLMQSSHYYIQNPTPYHLVEQLSQEINPRCILDLCCSPGGKLIALHDLFPSAELTGNDLSDNKVERASQNLARLGIPAKLTIHRGESYPTEKKYDLVILDVPCSNSGVLHKHPEARWRLEEIDHPDLFNLQRHLLAHADQLADRDAEIWYLTCSILPQENEKQVEWFCQAFGWKKRLEIIQLPTPSGWDGGYGCALRRG